MSFLASPHFLIGLAADQLLPHQCLLCSKFCVNRGVCAACWRTPSPPAAIRAGFVYNAFSRALILRVKHADGLYLTSVLGQFLVYHFAALHQPGNPVVPIPLHRHRYLARHYNQSAAMARWLAPADEFAPAILLRQHHNKSQSGLGQAHRHKNLAGVFTVVPKSRSTLSGRPVILIDDFMTTGATLTAATNCLLAAGSGAVYGLVLVRVL